MAKTRYSSTRVKTKFHYIDLMYNNLHNNDKIYNKSKISSKFRTR